MNKLLCTACAAAMSLAAMASTATAYAMPAPAFSSSNQSGIVDVRYDHGGAGGWHGGGGWGHPYYRHGGWRGGYDGWWIPPAAGFVTGAIIGNAIAGPRVYERVVPAGNAHVRWCYEHHAGYNPYNNTFRDGYGYRHVCYAPV